MTCDELKRYQIKSRLEYYVLCKKCKLSTLKFKWVLERFDCFKNGKIMQNHIHPFEISKIDGNVVIS